MKLLGHDRYHNVTMYIRSMMVDCSWSAIQAHNHPVNQYIQSKDDLELINIISVDLL